MRRINKSQPHLQKLSKRGFRGYPVATIALYGPDDKHASKVAVAIFLRESDNPDLMQRWTSKEDDVRGDPGIEAEIIALIRKHGVRSAIMTDRIIGCPHEEGVDYPEGEKCPQCPFWARRDRFTDDTIQ